MTFNTTVNLASYDRPVEALKFSHRNIHRSDILRSAIQLELGPLECLIFPKLKQATVTIKVTVTVTVG